MTKHTLEERIEKLERDMEELKSEVNMLKSLVSGIYSLDTSTNKPPAVSDNPYTTEDFISTLDKPTRLDKDGYRLYQKAKESQRKI